MSAVQLTLERAALLKTAYLSAKQTNTDLFTFEGNDYVTAYAGYLLQYLESQLGPIETGRSPGVQTPEVPKL